MELYLNKIILYCFLIYFLKLTSSSMGFRAKKSAYAFETFLDLNGDGNLDVTDFDQMAGNVLELKRFELNGKEHTAVKESIYNILNGILKQAGAKDVSYIKEDQWIKMWDDYAANPVVIPDWQQNYINLVFSWIVNNDDDLIFRNNFVSFMVIHGKSGSDAGTCFDKFSEGQGPVDKKKFLQLWKQYFISDDPSAPGNCLAGKLNFDTD